MTPEELKQRTKAFALASIRLFQTLPPDDVSRIIGKQFVRCATSVGANYRAACLAKSPADMINKLKIVEEEVDESGYWLELLEESRLVSPDALKALHQESTEIRKIITASILTLKDRSGRQAT